MESHSSGSGEQFTLEGVHGGTVHVDSEELQPDDYCTSESDCPPQDSDNVGMGEVHQGLKGKDEYVVEGDIFEAAQSGDIAMVENYLDLGFPPDLTDEEGWSILHHAASHGQVEMIKLLHERGCCIDPVDRHGRTPLHHAATSGEAVSIGVLVDLGGNVNFVDSEGNTPLKWAVMCGKYSTLEELLKYGGVEDVECEQRKEPSDEQRRHEFIAALDDETVRDLLIQSASTGDVQTVSAILDHGCPVDAVDSDGYTALHRAAGGGHVKVIRELITRGASVGVEMNNGYTPLHIAARNGKLEAVHELLRLGGRASITKVAGTGGTPLHQALLGGHKEIVLVLLDAGCPIDVVASNGRNVLHAAAQGGHVDLIGLLVERGLDVNGGDADGCTPLHSAAANGKLEAVYELLKLGGKPSISKVAGTYGTALHQAAFYGHREVVLFLLEAGCPINVVTSVGQNILHFAAQCGHVGLLGLLVEHDLGVNGGDANGCTPLHSAAANGKLEAVHELLRLGGKPSISKVAGTYGTPLHQAVFYGHREVVLVLLEAGCPINVVTSVGQNILHFAAECGNVGLIGLLVERGLDVNGDADGYTPLHSAAANGKLEAVHELLRLGGKPSILKVAGTHGTPLHQAVLGGHKEVVLVLLGAGCSINVVDSNNRNILHSAAQDGHVDLIGLLIECGLDVNGGDADGYTPLHSAAANGKLEAVYELLKLGGKPSISKVAGTYGTPLHQAAFYGHREVVLILLEAGCPINVVTSVGQNILHFAAQCGHVGLLGLLVEHDLGVNGGDANGCTPLHSAAANGKLEAVHELLRLGGKPSMTKVAGTYGTPLHQAAFYGHREVVLVLLEAGCPINIVTSVGQNILHFAAECGNVGLLGLLVERGLDVNGDADGYTPLHSAAANGKLEAVRELLRLGADPTVVAGVFGTPLHSAVFRGSVEVMSVLSEAIEQYHSQHPVDTGSEVESSHQLVCAPDKNPLDCCNSIGQTPVMWAAGEGNVEMVKLLISKNCSISARSSYGLSMFELAIMCGQMNKLSEICKACGFDCGESTSEIIIFLKNRNLLDLSKILVMGAFTGDPLVLTTLSSEEGIFTEAAHQTWSMTSEVLESYFPTVDIYHQVHLPEGCPLTSLHISLLTFKYTTVAINCNNSYKKNAKDYRLFIERLISHPLTKYTVNASFPNGLSPLDIAHRFDFHDVADMIERAGGGPGLWANLPREMEQQAIGAFLPLKALMNCEAGGQEVASRIVAHLFGAYPSRYSESQSEESVRDKILKKRPELRLIVKHVLPKLHHLDDWFDVGIILEVSEDELLEIQSHSHQNRVAYRTMLSTWLKHGRHVTWNTLLDAVGHFETKKTVDDMTNKIVEELAPLQVSLIDYVPFPELTRLEMGIDPTLFTLS